MLISAMPSCRASNLGPCKRFVRHKTVNNRNSLKTTDLDAYPPTPIATNNRCPRNSS